MQKQITLKVYGKVQGVFFRDATRKKAKELGLSGTAFNEPDGTVRIVAEGGEEALLLLVEWCKDGPEHAKVDRVEVRWRDHTGEFGDFTIRQGVI